MAAYCGVPGNVRKCITCGLVYKERVETSAALDAIYSTGYVHFDSAATQYGLAEIHSAKEKLQRSRRLLRTRRTDSRLRLLDVGCGAGGFVRIARSLGYDAQGIDPHLPDRLVGELLRRGTLADLEAGAYDIVVALNVAEHVIDPRPLFSGIRRLLKPGGVLLLSCPYGDSLARRFYRARWGHLVLDEHILFWTPGSLRRLLKELGFTGGSSHRIAGAPFPLGGVSTPNRNGAASGTAPGSASAAPAPASPGRKAGWGIQAQARRLGRWIQRRESLGNLVRHVVHATHSGDYLDFAIGTGDAP